MTVDRYTRAVLTVIAGCLLWICAMGIGQTLSAQSSASLRTQNASVQPVVIVGTGTLDPQGTVTVNYTLQDGVRRTDPTLPVALPYSTAKPLPVALPYSPAKPLPVALPYTNESPIPARLTNASDAPVPVEISAVRKVGEWEPIRTSVEDAPAKRKPGGGGGR
jgi:hypothetical protein